MPIVRVQMLAGRSQEIKQKIADEVTASIARHTGAETHHIYVMFEDVAKSDWAVAGKFFGEPACKPS